MLDRTLGVAVLLLFVYGVFVTKAYHHERDSFAQFKTATIAAGRAQEARTDQLIKNHEKAAQEARNAYSRHIDDIRSYYRVSNSARSGQMPTAASTTGRTNGLPAYDVLVEQCAETTEQLIDLQYFINSTKE